MTEQEWLNCTDMSEQEWLNCTDPRRMLDFLTRHQVDRLKIPPLISQRKFRLFIVACCYHVWDKVENELCRQEVIMLERYADGLATHNDYLAAEARAPMVLTRSALMPWNASEKEPEILSEERKAQAGFLRDIYNPRALTLGSGVLNWNDGTVVKVARAIYEEKAFDLTPILADALEESGCIDPALLAHLRGLGTHTRGCWALDAILGKD